MSCRLLAIRHVAIAMFCVVALSAQAGSRQQLQELASPAPGYRIVLVRTELDPGAQVAPHTHPGVEIGYVIAGRAELQVQGASDRALSAGDSFSIAPETVHSIRNVGAAPLTVLSSYIVQTGKPLLVPLKP